MMNRTAQSTADRLSRVVLWGVLGSCLVVASAMAQEPVAITAEVQPPVVLVGDQFRYRVVVNGSGAPEPTMPDFAPFVVVRTSRGSNISIVGNKQSVSIIYDTVLKATKAGAFTINPASLSYQGKTVTTEPVEVTVSQEASETVAVGSVNLPEGFISARTNDSGVNRQIQGRLFLYTELDGKSVVPYEPLIAKTFIYKAPGLVEGETYGFLEESSIPTGSDYLQIEILRSSSLDWTSVEVGDTTFQRALVEIDAVIPTKSGDLTFRASPLIANLPVQGGRRRNSMFDDPFGDPFSDFFGRSKIQAELPAPPRLITVKPLPEPKPSNYQGIVGDFEVAAAVDRSEVNEGEIVTLTVTFTGEGYPDAIPEPSLPAMDGFKLYDKTSEVKNHPTPEGVSGTKVFEYLLRAESPGDQVLPVLEFMLYSPQEGRYVTRSTAEIPIAVKPRGSRDVIVVAASGTPGAARSDIRTLSTDIAHIHTTGWSPSPGVRTPLFTMPWWWGMHIVPPLIFLASVIIRRRRRFYRANPKLLRWGRAAGEADRRLKKARAIFSLGDSDQFFGEVAMAVRGYIADKLGREASGLTLEEIETFLVQREVRDELKSHAIRLLESCDAARFSLGSDAPGSRQSILDEAALILRQLREALK